MEAINERAVLTPQPPNSTTFLHHPLAWQEVPRSYWHEYRSFTCYRHGLPRNFFLFLSVNLQMFHSVKQAVHWTVALWPRGALPLRFCIFFRTNVYERAVQCHLAKISILDDYWFFLLVLKDLFYMICLCPQRPQGSIRSSRAGIRDLCEPPSRGAWIWSLVLWQRVSTQSLSLLSSLWFFYSNSHENHHPLKWCASYLGILKLTKESRWPFLHS